MARQTQPGPMGRITPPITDRTECPECDGRCTVNECCGEDWSGTIYEDSDICPRCKDHLPGPEPCENCGGKGWVSE